MRSEPPGVLDPVHVLVRMGEQRFGVGAVVGVDAGDPANKPRKIGAVSITITYISGEWAWVAQPFLRVPPAAGLIESVFGRG